jgi:hypothetical protein
MYWESGAGVDRGTPQTTGTALVAGTWYHVAITVDNSGATSTVKFYVNGAIQQTTAGVVKATGGTTTTDFTIGGNGVAPTTHYHGALKDMRFSSAVRTAAEVAASAALTTYQHATDASTFAHYRFNEAPDAIEESEYGYHARKVAGTISVVDGINNDGGDARYFSTSTEYDCHWGYEPFRSAMTGDWTFQCWLKMDSGYHSRSPGPGIWVYGDPGVDSSATNFIALDLYGPTTPVLRVFQEYGAGSDSSSPMTVGIFPNVAAGLEPQLVTVTQKDIGGGTYQIKFYLGPTLLQTLTTANNYENGTTSWLRLSSGGSSGTNALGGTMDDARWLNRALDANEITTQAPINFCGGYDAGSRRLRLLPHAYSPTTESADVTHFAAGDEVHVVQVSPSTPTGALEWSDVIESIDTGAHMVTLTTGLDGFVCGNDYVLEYDAITVVGSGQRTAKAFIADEDDRSTGYATNDAYLWTGEPETAPDETWVYTQRYRKVNSEADDVGTAASVHKLNDLSRWAMTAAVYHGAPVYVNQPLTQAVTYGSGSTKRMVFGPVYVPLYYGTRRRLEVRLLVSSSASTCSFRAIMSALLPRGDGTVDFDSTGFFDVRTNTQNWTTLYTSSSAYEWQTGYIEVPGALPGYPGGGWFLVEASADGGGGTAGIKHVMLSEYVENVASADVRQETGWIGTVVNAPPVAARLGAGVRASAGAGAMPWRAAGGRGTPF